MPVFALLWCTPVASVAQALRPRIHGHGHVDVPSGKGHNLAAGLNFSDSWGDVAMNETPQWTVFEAALEAQRDRQNALWDVRVDVEFVGPSGQRRTVEAFWDGGRTWRVRFCPDAPGEWNWQSACSDQNDAGLNGQGGSFQCVPYDGHNAVYRGGPVRLSGDRRHFVHADGTPFFWLSDTAWNGALKSRQQDWERYLRTRREQEFTVVQFVCTHWRGGSTDREGETAFTGQERIHVNVEFFQRLDRKVWAVNENGLVVAPVMLWAYTEDDPGQALPEESAVRVLQYMVARWGACQVVWIVGGDGHYQGEKSERWKRIGRQVFGQRHDRLVTMHPCGQSWVADEFRGEPWFDFVGYQSGHGDSPDHLRWLAMGPPATDWLTEPARPIVNLEPNYEAFPAYYGKRPFTDREVRRAAYWSLLVSPPAGLSFGHNAIWVWAEGPALPEGHEGIGTVGPWHEGLDTPGIRSMTVMRRFLDELPWWRLRPAPELLARQPGEDEIEAFVAAAATDGGDLAVLYLPRGGAVSVRTETLKSPAVARWFDPRSGRWQGSCDVTQNPEDVAAPDEDDWLLVIRPAGP